MRLAACVYRAGSVCALVVGNGVGVQRPVGYDGLVACGAENNLRDGVAAAGPAGEGIARARTRGGKGDGFRLNGVGRGVGVCSTFQTIVSQVVCNSVPCGGVGCVGCGHRLRHVRCPAVERVTRLGRGVRSNDGRAVSRAAVSVSTCQGIAVSRPRQCIAVHTPVGGDSLVACGTENYLRNWAAAASPACEGVACTCTRIGKGDRRCNNCVR